LEPLTDRREKHLIGQGEIGPAGQEYRNSKGKNRVAHGWMVTFLRACYRPEKSSQGMGSQK
jgi:hypothetical protein